MNKDEIYNYEYALGLISTKQQHKQVKSYNEKLTILNIIAPINKDEAKVVWRKINKQIWKNKLNKYIKIYKLFILILIAPLLTTFNISSNTIIASSYDTGWDIALYNNKLSITAVKPPKIAVDEVCVLWLKKDNKFQLIAMLPEQGSKSIILSASTTDKFKDTQMIISIEKQHKFIVPTRVSYSKYI